MSPVNTCKLVILSGPSCVGKTPLFHALGKFYPQISDSLAALVLYNSRNPRPGEKEGIDYFFRPRECIEDLRQKEGYLVMDVRGDLQAMDVEQLQKQLQSSDVIFEGNPFIGTALLQHRALKKNPKMSIFIAPISHEEIIFLKSRGGLVLAQGTITDMMRKKLLRRTEKQKGILSESDLENIEKRSKSAYKELQQAYQYDCVIPNHDGEDSENWDAFYCPVGEARKTLLSVAAILQDKTPVYSEKWEEGLL